PQGPGGSWNWSRKTIHCLRRCHLAYSASPWGSGARMDRLDFYKNTGHRTYNWSIRLAFVVMVSIGLRGLGGIGWGLLYSMKELFFWHSSDGHSVGSIPAVEVGIGSILDGFEFLLLAPLAFVIVVSIGNYLRALLQYDRVIEAEHQVHRVKGLIISL